MSLVDFLQLFAMQSVALDTIQGSLLTTTRLENLHVNIFVNAFFNFFFVTGKLNNY